MYDIGSLEERNTAQFASLTPKQRMLARFVLDNKYFLTYATAGQAGQRVGTSAATVVRFAHALSYEGYSQMQIAIRQEMPRYHTAVEHLRA